MDTASWGAVEGWSERFESDDTFGTDGASPSWTARPSPLPETMFANTLRRETPYPALCATSASGETLRRLMDVRRDAPVGALSVVETRTLISTASYGPTRRVRPSGNKGRASLFGCPPLEADEDSAPPTTRAPSSKSPHPMSIRPKATAPSPYQGVQAHPYATNDRVGAVANVGISPPEGMPDYAHRLVGSHWSRAPGMEGQRLTFEDLTPVEQAAASLGVQPNSLQPISWLNDAHYSQLVQANALGSDLNRRVQAYRHVSKTPEAPNDF